MRHKVSELEGPLLDAAVAMGYGWRGAWKWRDFAPSVDWADGGSIIEREGIGVSLMEGGVWTAVIDPKDRASYFAFRDSSPAMVEGPTPLVAAMRAFVRAKLGDEVELP